MRFAACVFAPLLFAGIAMADPVGSAFTYQGQLTDAGSPANDAYDFEFALFTGASGGSAVDTISVDDLLISRGLINASLDFTDACPAPATGFTAASGARLAGLQPILFLPMVLNSISRPEQSGVVLR